ncbi:MAG: hypothetical protein GX115_17310 [Ruminiclostridium sp.]|nr:hypothetical protein [Ruminiclostridium sp.]
MEENWLDIMCSVVFTNNAKQLLQYALSLGYKDITHLLDNYESVLRQFMCRHWYEDKIEEMDKSISELKGYRKAS